MKPRFQARKKASEGVGDPGASASGQNRTRDLLRTELSWRVSIVRGDQNCPNCGNPLREIDFYGRRLAGCIRCNLWGIVGSGRLFMELPTEDLEELNTRQAAAER